MTHTATPRSDELGTVGQLSRRTGIPIKAIRDYTDHGPVNTRGRSAAGYRTYTSEALWCLQFITTLRGLGLTLAEIRGQTHPHPQPPGPRLADLLIASRRRIDERVAALKAKTRHGERPTGLHDDQRCEVRDSRVTLRLDRPCGRARRAGRLDVSARSHRRGGPERIDAAEFNFDDAVRDDKRSYLFDHWPELEWMPRVTVPLRAGDATFHHRRTAHAAGANHTAADRVSIALTYTDADATFKPRPCHDRLPYRPGQPLPADRYPRVAAEPLAIRRPVKPISWP